MGERGGKWGESMEFWLAYYILTVAPVVSPLLKTDQAPEVELDW